MTPGRVVIAMSGGVDSSVAAALLKQEGYDVIGVMLNLWSESGREELNRCCTPDSQAVARRVAARLDIPFHVVDVKDQFKASVVQAFVSGYERGITPNPCVTCNRQIKWGFLLEQALAMGADFLATGHYARKQQRKDGRWELLRAVDRTKDQSYVLHVLTQEKLARALFPVGEYNKTEIRALAERFNLPSASHSDSQDLCFLGGEDYRTFLRRFAPGLEHPGPIQSRDGRLMGEHRGLAFYTIGQRKGLGVASQVPLFVLEKIAGTNTLVVGPEEELGTSELHARDVNWILGDQPQEDFRAEVKTRYTAREAMSLITPQHRPDGKVEMVRVQFDDLQRDITPGQAAVFFDGNSVLGGGTIV